MLWTILVPEAGRQGETASLLIAIFTFNPCSASCDRRTTHATTATHVATSSALQGASNIWQIAANTEAVAI
jgi:hypothetical protein